MLKKIDLYGLAYFCPHLERQSDCPFKQNENLSFQEKVKWINTLSEEEKETILKHHQLCSQNR